MAKRARTTTTTTTISTTTTTTTTLALASTVLRMSLSLLLMMMVTSLPTVVTALGHPTGVGGHGSLNGGGLKLSQVDGKVSTTVRHILPAPPFFFFFIFY